jgi:hypothetical protein
MKNFLFLFIFISGFVNASTSSSEEDFMKIGYESSYKNISNILRHNMFIASVELKMKERFDQFDEKYFILVGEMKGYKEISDYIDNQHNKHPEK